MTPPSTKLQALAWLVLLAPWVISFALAAALVLRDAWQLRRAQARARKNVQEYMDAYPMTPEQKAESEVVE